MLFLLALTDCIHDVMVIVLVSCVPVVEMASNPGKVNPIAIKFVFVVSPLSTQH